MSVDLSQYLDQEVRVTYENGDKIIGRVKYYPVNKYNKLNYSVRDEDNLGSTYTRDGFYWTSKGPHPLNIVKIEPITMKKYEQLENQINDIKGCLRNIPSYKVPQEAIMAIQSWVIESYKQQYGN